MKLKKGYWLLLITAMVLLVACSKKGPSYSQYIPKEARYVIALDVKSMIEKLGKESLTLSNMLDVLQDSADSSKYAGAIGIWKQFKDGGIDLDHKILLVMPGLKRKQESVEIEILAGIKDESKLQALVAKLPGASEIIKEKGTSYAVVDEWVIGWRKEVVMILGAQTTGIPGGILGDGSGVPAPAPPPGDKAAMVEKMKSYFSLKKDESMASVSALEDLVSATGDVAVYSNSGSLAGEQAGMAMAMMPRVRELLEGMYSTSIINFEDGKMVLNSNTFTGKKLAGILSKYTGPRVAMNLVDPYPGNNIGGVAAFSFNTELIPALLKETGLDAIVNPALAMQGINIADIVKAFKGDFAVIFSDFAIERTEKTIMDSRKYMARQPSAKLLVAASIGDKSSFEKVLEVGIKTGRFKKQGNRILPARDGVVDTISRKFILGIENNTLVFSNDELVYKTYSSKTGKIGLSNEARNTINGASIAFFMDAEKILNGIPGSVFDTTGTHEKNILAKSKTIFKSLHFRTDNFDGEKISGSGELNMMGETNSLPQLVQFLVYVNEQMKQKHAEDQAKWNDVDNAVQ